MGIYLNPGAEKFRMALHSKIYVDKTAMLALLNEHLNTEGRYVCVSRPRRFGKSMAANMIAAYYDRTVDGAALFQGCQIAADAAFDAFRNRFDVLQLNMQEFLSRAKDMDSLLLRLRRIVLRDLFRAYPDVDYFDREDIVECMQDIYAETKRPFVIIIDEWDCIFREYPHDTAAQRKYLDFLRDWLKDKAYIGLAYMTGILPIKKYKTESALNNFQEYSMVDPRRMARYFGFTKDEVRVLADKHCANFDELEKWYDGYQVGDEPSVFNPNSVMQAIDSGRCRSFWAGTGAYDAVARYIQMNYEGLKDDVISMLAGERCPVDPTGFQNDMSVIRSKDDVLTVLIHLGYLSYDWRESECYIPNKEVAGEMVNAIKSSNWKHVSEAIEKSKQLMKATLAGDEAAVARGIDVAHDEHTSILSYNDENSLACVLSIAYYYANNDYVIHRELATGKGFADLVLIPRKNVDSPAIVIELKYNKDADTAISQILRKEYPAKVAQYADSLLLVGINYDRETKQHECHIINPSNCSDCGG